MSRARSPSSAKASPTSGPASDSSATSSPPTCTSVARTPLLGNVWWVLDPLLQMLVYLVFITIITNRPLPGLSAVHLRGDPALEVVHGLGRGLDHVGRQPGQPDQADRLPQDRAAGLGRDRGRRGVRVRADPALRAHGLLPGPHHPLPAVHPGDRRGPVRLHARRGLPRRGRQCLLPRPRQRLAAHPPPLVVPVARPVQPGAPR